MEEAPSPRSIGNTALRTAWLFQGLAAFPTLFILGSFAFASLFPQNGIYLYDFITYSVTSLMAAGIIFLVLVQRKTQQPSKSLTLAFEGAKTVLAQGLWLWLILDAAFGPWPDRYPYRRPDRSDRVTRAAISVLLLFVLFYPTVGYAYYEWYKAREARAHDARADEEAGERTALLAETT